MRKSEKQNLDQIGKAVVKAVSIPAPDIDQIVAKPDLFDGVRKRIVSEISVRDRRTRLMRPGFAAVSMLILVAIGSLAFFGLRSEPVDVTRIPVPPSPKTDEPRRFTNPDRIVVDEPVVRGATPLRPERISVSRQSERIMRPKPVAVRQTDQQRDFYALSYAGDPNETERGGRIVRVDISRSTLFAMGFELPLENESETFRADLLIGSDGVTRAVRVVE